MIKFLLWANLGAAVANFVFAFILLVGYHGVMQGWINLFVGVVNLAVFILIYNRAYPVERMNKRV